MLNKLGDYQVVEELDLPEDDFRSNVLLVKHSSKHSEQLFDAWVYPTDKMSTDEINITLEQIRVLCSLKHPAVLNFVDAFMLEASKQLVIVVEHADLGSLETIFKARKKLLKKKDAKSAISQIDIVIIMTQIIMGAMEMHRYGRVHMNINLKNVYCCKNGFTKLSGFGATSEFGKPYRLKSKLNPWYSSPECFKGEPLTEKSDVWSLGIVFYELLFNELPFQGESREVLMKSIFNLEFPKPSHDIPQRYNEIVRRMLALEPKDRPNLVEILETRVFDEAIQIIQEKLPEYKEVFSKYKDDREISGRLKADTSILPESVKKVNPPLNKPAPSERKGPLEDIGEEEDGEGEYADEENGTEELGEEEYADEEVGEEEQGEEEYGEEEYEGEEEESQKNPAQAGEKPKNMLPMAVNQPQPVDNGYPTSAPKRTTQIKPPPKNDLQLPKSQNPSANNSVMVQPNQADSFTIGYDENSRNVSGGDPESIVSIYVKQGRGYLKTKELLTPVQIPHLNFDVQKLNGDLEAWIRLRKKDTPSEVNIVMEPVLKSVQVQRGRITYQLRSFRTV